MIGVRERGEGSVNAGYRISEKYVSKRNQNAAQLCVGGL